MDNNLPDKATGPLARRTVFAYGVLCYSVGLLGLTAVILRCLGLIPVTGGFLGELDGVSAWLVDGVLIAAFGIQHAIMARPWFKRWWTQQIPEAAERPTFVLLAGLLAGAIVWLWQPMPEIVWEVESAVLGIALHALAVAGFLYLLTASFAIDHFQLFGLRQVFGHLRSRKVDEPRFVERLQYRFDRHPIMSGMLIGLWSVPCMTVDRLALAGGLTFYIIVGVAIEERSLVHQHGETYRAYRRRVRSLVPPLPGAS